jgi:hypothetical protein
MMIRNPNARQKEVRSAERRARKLAKIHARRAARQQRRQGGNLGAQAAHPGGR